ncbi:MAG: hypothetical protein QXW19_03010 [Candidatus Bathyarchaeia archaeon]
MKEAFANYIVAKKSIRGRVYETARIFIPTKLSTDSSFPFKGKRVRVLIRISGDKLIISKPKSKRASNPKPGKGRRWNKGGEGRRS